MSNPFPGMNPYLEAHWGDVHARLIMYASDQLQAQLPATLRARVEERVYLEVPDEPRRSFYPDVSVVERSLPGDVSGEQFASSAMAVAEKADDPLVIHIENEVITETFIEIREVASGNRVITAIEFVSPANKRQGVGRQQYLVKQEHLRAGEINSVEIDLLRTEENVIAVAPETVAEHYRTPYRACVWRAARPLAYEYYRMPLKERLPRISIPLRKGEKDVVLDLQALIGQCYKNGGYDDIDYTRDPVPPLIGEDVKWADSLLRAAGLRR
jgi:hypothetical protein